MEEIVKDWFSGNPEPWQLLIGVIVLVSFVAQRLTSLRETWFEFRASRSRLLLEKQQLEILKLKYEIEALRKANQLPEIAAAPLALQVTKEIHVEQPRRSAVWKLFARYPLLAWVLLRGAQAVVGLYFLLSLLGLLAALFEVVFPEPEPDESWLLVSVIIMYGVFAYVCYAVFCRLGVWLKDLRAADAPMAAKSEG